MNLEEEPSEEDPPVAWDDMEHVAEDEEVAHWFPDWRAQGRIGHQFMQARCRALCQRTSR